MASKFNDGINRNGLEQAARLIEANIIKDTSAGKVLAPRQEGNRDGLHYAEAIRALSPPEPVSVVEEDPRELYAAAERTFTDYFVRNYPGPDTIIFDPKWHAPKLFAAAARALRDATPAPPERRDAQAEHVTLTYTNWRGETAKRTIVPKRVWFGATDWHPEPQWLLTAFDCEKQADRDFALKDFGSASPPADLCELTFAVQHNPNCPAPWLVRLPGKGPIDMKPYGDRLGLVAHQTGDILGFGKTLDEAARAALSAKGADRG